MIFKYKPSSFFKGISNDRLKAIFDKAGIDLGIDWEKRNPKKDATVADKWDAYMLPEEKKDDFIRLQEIFQRICVIANSRTNSLTIIHRFADFRKISKLPEDFDDEAKWCKTERGAYIYLENGLEALRAITELIYAEDISYSDHMVDYQTERVEITQPADLKNKLKQALSDFFEVSKEDREQVRMESYPMAGTDQNYFFYTKDGDVENMELRLETEKEIELKLVRRPYSVVFTYDNFTIKPAAAAGTNDDEEDTDDTSDDAEEAATTTAGAKPGTKLSLYAMNIRAAKRDKLAAVIMTVLSGQNADMERIKKTSYRLNCFATAEYKFPDMTDLGIRGCHARRIGIIASANPEDEMIFNNLKKNNAYESMKRSFKWCRNISSNRDPELDLVYEQPFKVSLISIAMVTTENKIITFDLRKNSCNRHNYHEDTCKLIQALIDRTRIEE